MLAATSAAPGPRRNLWQICGTARGPELGAQRERVATIDRLVEQVRPVADSEPNVPRLLAMQPPRLALRGEDQPRAPEPEFDPELDPVAPGALSWERIAIGAHVPIRCFRCSAHRPRVVRFNQPDGLREPRPRVPCRRPSSAAAG